jgi:hypothetical protein
LCPRSTSPGRPGRRVRSPKPAPANGEAL